MIPVIRFETSAPYRNSSQFAGFVTLLDPPVTEFIFAENEAVNVLGEAVNVAPAAIGFDDGSYTPVRLTGPGANVGPSGE